MYLIIFLPRAGFSLILNPPLPYLLLYKLLPWQESYLSVTIVSNQSNWKFTLNLIKWISLVFRTTNNAPHNIYYDLQPWLLCMTWSHPLTLSLMYLYLNSLNNSTAYNFSVYPIVSKTQSLKIVLNIWSKTRIYFHMLK